MYTFTNTIQNPKGYPYYLKVVIYSDNGITGGGTYTNGGYILNIGDVTDEIDPFTGEYKPGSLSIEMMNIGDEVSDNIFGGTIVEMELRLWISYDSGSTWENLFFGTVEWEGLTRTDSDATETENRRYSFTARHSILSLKDIEIDTDPDAGLNVPTSGVVTPGATITAAATDANGTPYYGLTDDGFKFISLDGVLQYIFSNTQFIAGATAPTLSYDSTAMQHKGKNIPNATEYTFDKLYMFFYEGGAIGLLLFQSFFQFSAGKYSIYESKNLQEVLRMMMDALLMLPITRMTESGGSFALDVYFEPRLRAAADLTAISGTLDYTITRTMTVAEWLDGYQVITIGLPEKSYGTISYGGRLFEIKNILMTGPYFGVDPYIFQAAYVVPDASTGLQPIEHPSPSAQMLYGIDGATVENIHLFKHVASQSYYGDAVSGGYYGVHGSAFNLIAANLDPATRSSIYGPRAYEITAKTLASNNAGTYSIWDLRLLKKMTIDGVTCMIISIRRSVMSNTITIRAIEVL